MTCRLVSSKYVSDKMVCSKLICQPLPPGKTNRLQMFIRLLFSLWIFFSTYSSSGWLASLWTTTKSGTVKFLKYICLLELNIELQLWKDPLCSPLPSFLGSCVWFYILFLVSHLILILENQKERTPIQVNMRAEMSKGIVRK